MNKTGEQFIHSKDQDLHHSNEVELVIAYLKSSGEKIPNNPADKISAYLGFLANKDLVDDGIFTGNKDSIDRQIEQLLIKDENVPESYFQLQQRLAFEQGHGHIEITPGMRRQLVEAMRADQKASLNKWAEYINGPDGTYPVWFEYFVWESLKKLGQFNKEKGEFTKRTKSTTAPYPELNREALAYVYDKLSRSLNGNVADEPEKLQKLLLSGNFGKLYAHALLEATSTKEIIKTIEGSWKKYNQTNDPRTARRLSGSLQGYGTGWCTAGQETASKQLQGGDFYVYYTKDEEAKDTIPRVAIRMKNGEVAEVRGIRDAQELEPELYDIVDAKLKDLPGGAEYQTKVADMKRVTEIYNLVKKDSEVELSTDDLRFIYELDKSIKGFGYYTDPRIEEIITGRDVMQDYSQIYETSDRAELAKALIAEGRSYIVASNLDKFLAEADHAGLAKTLITEGKALLVASNLDKFEPGSVDRAELAKALIAEGSSYVVADNLDEFLAEADHAGLAKTLITESKALLVARNLDKFEPGSVDRAELAKALIAEGDARYVADHLDDFEPGSVDHAGLAKALIAEGRSYIVADNLDKFEPGSVDRAELAKALIAEGSSYVVADNLDEFEPGSVDHAGLAKALIAGGNALAVARNLDKFEPGSVDHAGLAKTLITEGKALVVASILDEFEPGSVDHAGLAKALIAGGYSLFVARNLDKFKLSEQQKKQLGLS